MELPLGHKFEAVLWSAAGKGTILQNWGSGGGGSQALAINKSGQSVGWNETPGKVLLAVLWSNSGIPTKLKDIGGSHSSDAVAINNLGQSVGFSKTARRPGRGSVVVVGDGD